MRNSKHPNYFFNIVLPHHRPHLQRRHPNRPPALRLSEQVAVFGNNQAGGLGAPINLGLQILQNPAIGPVTALPARKPHPQVVGFAPVLVVGAVEPNVRLQQRVQRGQGFDALYQQGAGLGGWPLPCFEVTGPNEGLEFGQKVVAVDQQTAGTGVQQAFGQVLRGRNGRGDVFGVGVVFGIDGHGLAVNQRIGLLAQGQAPGFGQHGAFQRFFVVLQGIDVVQGVQCLRQYLQLGGLRLQAGLVQTGVSGVDVGGHRPDFVGQLGQGAQGFLLGVLKRRQQAAGLGQFFGHLGAGAVTLVLLRLPGQYLLSAL